MADPVVRKNQQTPQRWMPCVNGNATLTAPAFACLTVTGAGTDALLTVDRPSADGGVLVFNGPVPIPPGGYGHVTADCPVFALYDGADGTPAAGNVWGGGKNSYSLRKGIGGYVVWGGVSDGSGLVMVMPDVGLNSGVTNVCATLGTALAPGSSGGTMQVVTAITVQYLHPDGTVTCVTNPTNCCEGGGSVLVSCCPVPINNVLCVTFSGWLSPLGSVLLTYTGGAWITSGYPSPSIPIPNGGTLCNSSAFGVSLSCYNGSETDPCGAVQTGGWHLVVTFPNPGVGQTYVCASAANAEVVCGPPFVATFSAFLQDTIPSGAQCSDFADASAVVSSDLTTCGESGSCTGIMDTGIGTASDCSSPSSLTLTYSGPSVGGSLVVVSVGAAGWTGDASATFNGAPMTPAFNRSSSLNTVYIFYYLVPGAHPGTATIVVTTGAGPTALLMSAVQVQGLTNNALQGFTGNSGTSDQPTVPGPGVGADCNYIQGAFMLESAGGAWTWDSPMTPGGQDVTACSPYALTEGFEIAMSAPASVKLDGVTPADWCGVAVAFN